MYCQNCGYTVSEDDLFCTRCGEILPASDKAQGEGGTSDLALTLAAIVAIVSVCIAVWSFFDFRSIEVRRDQPGSQTAIQSTSTPIGSEALILPITPSQGQGNTSLSQSTSQPTPQIDIIAEDYRTYKNSKFDFSVRYPADFLVPQGENPNGDGERFMSADGSVVMGVHGAYNSLGQGLRDLFDEATVNNTNPRVRTVTYKLLRDNWFVVSGYEGGKVFYQKTFLEDGMMKTLRIDCDLSQKEAMQPITELIVKSFKG